MVVKDTPADAWSAQQSNLIRLIEELQEATLAGMNRCGELIRALDADDGSRRGRANLASVSPEMFYSIYRRPPRTGWSRRILGP